MFGTDVSHCCLVGASVTDGSVCRLQSVGGEVGETLEQGRLGRRVLWELHLRLLTCRLDTEQVRHTGRGRNRFEMLKLEFIRRATTQNWGSLL